MSLRRQPFSRPLPLEAQQGACRAPNGLLPWIRRFKLLIAALFLLGVGFFAATCLEQTNIHLPFIRGTSPTPLDVDAWIQPPEQAGREAISLNDIEHPVDSIDVPEGSTLHVDISDSPDPPVLEVAGRNIAWGQGTQGRLVATATIAAGDAITLRQGWSRLAYWRIRAIRDTPPRIAFLDQPVTLDRKVTRLAYEASDDYGIASIALRVWPAGSPQKPEVIELDTPETRHVKDVAFEDLTFLPWAGSTVEMQLVAKDTAGHESVSAKMATPLVKREFSNPLAKALIEERAKLLKQPDESTRDETANIMAGIARETAHYGDDPVVFLALRTGAVRLVLDHSDSALPAVSRLMWQTAARIEDIMFKKAHDFLRQAERRDG